MYFRNLNIKSSTPIPNGNFLHFRNPLIVATSPIVWKLIHQHFQSITKVKECGICLPLFVISKDNWRIIFHALTNKTTHNTYKYQHNKQLLGEQASSSTFNLASKIATNKNVQCLEIQPIKCKKILNPKLTMHLK